MIETGLSPSEVFRTSLFVVQVKYIYCHTLTSEKLQNKKIKPRLFTVKQKEITEFCYFAKGSFRLK
jgi:hypothetical protein